ncbi:hypothetical protein GBAR_LOCUS13597 [Geodia barretti]|uniref:Uncharacterized protein n=1 Tax=Geodia barretti TaxID=519541 RepID=A0AA35S679_GEOBA|nr:hypothetical protein GBAR_LOCUS13597 [Geodia barretti]
MSMTVGEVARSPDQLCSLPERPLELPAAAILVRDMTNISRGGGRGDGGRKQHVVHCNSESLRLQGDELIHHGNREKRDGGLSGERVGGGEESRWQVLTGASLLRQQWARHTQPKVHLSETDDEEGTGRESHKRESCSSPANKTSPQLERGPARSSPDPVPTETPPSRTHRSHQLLKTHSMGSISSESLTISSLWDTPSYDTVPDFLSSLGFDDFDSPELIPDRFIPPELEFVMPSLMRQSTLGSVSADGVLVDLSPPTDNLLLGASADSVVDDSSAGQSLLESALPPHTLALYLPSGPQLPWQPASLETVAEETASELLSPRPPSRQSSRLTPRLSSPIVSIDHTPTQEVQWGLEADVSAGLLGAGLRLRQQSLAKDDLRGRQMSLGAESDTSSLYFSVGSHFDEGEKEVESGSGGKEGGVNSGEETDTPNRRRRRGNYAPPPQLLMWLEKSESTEEDVTDLPWPFSENSSAEHSASDPPPPPSISVNGNFHNK